MYLDFPVCNGMVCGCRLELLQTISVVKPAPPATAARNVPLLGLQERVQTRTELLQAWRGA